MMTVLGVAALLGAVTPTDTPVADAAMRGDLVAVRSLLEDGADVNAAQGDGMTALHWASERGDHDMTQLLIRAGASVEAVTRIGHYTPLHLAGKTGSTDVLATLLDAGSSVDAPTTSGARAIHFAAASGSVSAVAVLLDHGADPDALESEWGQTPLMFAAALDRARAIQVLLERGADPGIASKTVDLVARGKLEEAAGRRQSDVLKAVGGGADQGPTPDQVQAAAMAARQIIVSGVVPQPEEEETEEEDQDDEGPPPISSLGGLTPLLHAARQGHIEAAVALLDGGADVNQVSASDHTSPLLMAVINGQFDMAMLLLERGADPNVAADLNGVMPLWAAVNAQWQPRTRFPQPQEMLQQDATYLDVMKALLDAGADPNARTAMHPWYMVYSGCGNRNCGLADTKGSTAFWRAAYATDVDAMRLLVAHGADPDIPTSAPAPPRPRGRDGASGQEADSTRVDSADVPKLDPSGLPPVPEGGPGVFAIHAAAGVGYGEGFAGNAHRHAPDGWLPSVKYLVEEVGADVNARDFNGYTPLHHAAARGDDEMILYLIEMGADVTAVSRRDQTVADMANGPVSRVSPFPKIVALLESLGSKNNHRCLTC
jgi:ankyrin repeat protein